MILKFAVAFCAVITVALSSDRTWYEEGAILRVFDGVVTIELLANDSRPRSVIAERRGIVEVKKGFAIIPSLELLSLENNDIRRIDGSVFDGLPGLVHLNLARNSIRVLVEDSFEGLPNLRVLNLDRNVLTNSLTFSITKSTLPSLTHLYLEHNTLKTIINSDIKQRTLLCDSNLRHLYLRNNTLERFILDDYENKTCLMHLTHLNLESNSLFGNYKIGINVPLESLILDNNWIRILPPINPELKFLSITGNSVVDMKGLETAKNIVRILLSQNQINLAKDVYFQNLSSLEHLALDGNSITGIADGCFSNLPSLRTLDLTSNQIRNISPHAFADLPSLTKLSFENNQIASFPGKESFGESNLAYLDLSNNKVENVANIRANMIPKLKTLKLTGNPLKSIEPFSVSNDTTIIF